MSRGRINTAATLDFYPTPERYTRAFLGSGALMRPGWRGEILRILEPAAGDGAMVGPLRDAFPRAEIVACDVHPRAEGIRERDFLMPYLDEAPLDGFDLVFTNPPFLHARAFVERSLAALQPGGAVVMLLRLAFLESQERRDWWRTHMPYQVWTLAGRPSFTGNGTDAAAYGWFVWRDDWDEDYFEGRIL